jgi:hypothetical protein
MYERLAVLFVHALYVYVAPGMGFAVAFVPAGMK